MVNYSSGGDSDTVKLGLVAEPFQLETSLPATLNIAGMSNANAAYWLAAG